MNSKKFIKLSQLAAISIELLMPQCLDRVEIGGFTCRVESKEDTYPAGESEGQQYDLRIDDHA